MAIEASPKVKQKLKEKHSVTLEDVAQCFANRRGKYLIDNRPQHKTTPPTMWFIAETDMGRQLKIVFIQEDGDIHLRTAYPANNDEIDIYNKYGI